jgi:hypothetical protein
MNDPFWSWQLLLAILLNCIVQAVGIAAYAARLAGAKSGRVGTAMSLFNVFVTASRFAFLLYTPLLGALSDRAGRLADTSGFLWQLRLIVASGALGAVVGTLALPAFVALYLRGIRAFERSGSVVKAAIRALRPQTARAVLQELCARPSEAIFRFSFQNVPKDILALNTCVTAIYGIGVLSAAYASVLNPLSARTALLSSGLVNGFAAITYNVVVDPASALMTDRAVHGERTVDDVKALVTGLSITAILGFVISQALLLPAAFVLEHAAEVIAAH